MLLLSNGFTVGPRNPCRISTLPLQMLFANQIFQRTLFTYFSQCEKVAVSVNLVLNFRGSFYSHAEGKRISPLSTAKELFVSPVSALRKAILDYFC